MKPCPRPTTRCAPRSRKQEPLLGDNIPATPQVLNRYNAAIRQFFDGKVEATGELSADSGNLEIVFRPPGERARIAEVKFTGNPGNADGPSAPEAFEGRGRDSL